MKVLVIEDDPQMARFLEKKLSLSGIEVVVANDGKEGLAMALQGGHDLILLDIQMSKMSGAEVLKHLRSTKHGKDIPVIVFTNSAIFAETKDDIDGLYDEFVTKSDIEFDALIEKVKSYEKKT